MKPTYPLILCFLVCFLAVSFAQAAQMVHAPPTALEQPAISTKKIVKKHLKKTAKIFAKKHGGYAAMFYVLLLMLVDILLLILFIVSLIFSWKILAWILGIVLSIQLIAFLLLTFFG